MIYINGKKILSNANDNKIRIKKIETNKIFKNIQELKNSNLSKGDIVETLGYYSENDNGGALYEIVSYEEWWNSLPEDAKTVSYVADWWGYKFTKTPVDEFGNHTLNNGLVAKLIRKNGVTKVEQWGCVGDGVSNNTTPLIHLFGQTKTGIILFGKNKKYVLNFEKYNRAYYDDDIFNSFDNVNVNRELCGTNEYTCSVGAYMGTYENYRKPTLSNIENVVLDGNGSEIFIPDNSYAKGTSDFGIFELLHKIDGLEIKNFIFNGNGLNQKQYIDDAGISKDIRTTNHTLFYAFGNCNLDYSNPEFSFYPQLTSLGIDISYYDSLNPVFNNVNIHHNIFKNSGTSVQTGDQGGDFILIINPLESKNVYIEDNEFYDWGRWVFSVDLGGDGERLYNYKFNRNKCYLTENNYFINESGENRIRGLGWIDFEARKCWTGLEICDNEVIGLPCFAFNGNGKVSTDIVIKNNKLIRSNLYYYSAYQYGFLFYSVKTNGLLVEDNIIYTGANSAFGESLENATFRRNTFDCRVDLSRLYGDIIFDGNRTYNGNTGEDDTLDCIAYYSILGMPEYATEPHKLNFQFINNRGYLNGRFYELDDLDLYNFTNLIIENNISNRMEVRGFGIEYLFDSSQILQGSLSNWCVKGAKLSNPLNLGEDDISWIKKGGFIVNEGDTIAINNKGDKLVCTKSGYLVSNGDWDGNPDNPFVAGGTSYRAENYFYTNENLYVTLNDGTLGTETPTHTSGIETSGNVQLAFICNIAQYQVINV